MNICEMTALEISNAVKNKEISVKDAVDAFFAAIDEYDGKYHCYNTLCKKGIVILPQQSLCRNNHRPRHNGGRR